MHDKQYNTSPLMQGHSDQDNNQQFSPRRTQEGFLLDSSSHAIPVPIDQLAEEEERLKEETIPQQSQMEYVRYDNKASNL